jgi:hypothetical protein
MLVYFVIFLLSISLQFTRILKRLFKIRIFIFFGIIIMYIFLNLSPILPFYSLFHFSSYLTISPLGEKALHLHVGLAELLNLNN